MNVVASTSAHFGHSRLAVFAGNGPRLAIVGRGREGGALGPTYGMPDLFSDHCETIDEIVTVTTSYLTGAILCPATTGRTGRRFTHT